MLANMSQSCISHFVKWHFGYTLSVETFFLPFFISMACPSENVHIHSLSKLSPLGLQ